MEINQDEIRRLTARRRGPIYPKYIKTPEKRVYAARLESESCQAGTVGCGIDHEADHGSCGGW